MSPLFVFSPQRWSLSFQRPQQLMSRLARQYQVFFVEPPLPCLGVARLQSLHLMPGVELLVPHLPGLPSEAAGFADAHLPALQALLDGFMRQRSLSDCVAWTYSAQALPLIQGLQPRGIVYDCISEPAPEHAALEAALLKAADLVLASGPTLYGAKHGLNPQVHCLINAVDARQFATETLADDAHARTAERLHAGMPMTRLGYFGVVDDRIDMTLLTRLADARPDTQIVMAGPVHGIEPCTLPSRPNISWLGAQPHERLPHLLAQWDACLIPFVVDQRTRGLNPVKTLEYLAGGKPVIATALPDVIALYGDVVRVAHNAGDFLDACEEVLTENGFKRSERAINMLSTVSTASWDRAADSVHALMLATLPPETAPAARFIKPSAAQRARLLPILVRQRSPDKLPTPRTNPTGLEIPAMKTDPVVSFRLAPLAACALMLSACASPPTPNPQIAVSNASIEAARSAGATELAPAELESAKAKLEQARALAQRGDWVEAMRLAEAADIDAQVARAKAGSERSRRAVAEVDASLLALREEMNRSATRTPQ